MKPSSARTAASAIAVSATVFLVVLVVFQNLWDDVVSSSGAVKELIVVDLTAFDTATAGLSNPRSVVIDEFGAVIVADAGVPESPFSGKIVRIERNGATSELVAGIGNGVVADDRVSYLIGVAGLALGEAGLYVALGASAWLTSPIYGPNRLLLVDDASGSTTTVREVFDIGLYELQEDPDGSGVVSNAGGVAIANNGDIWVADSGGNWVSRLTPAGDVVETLAFPPFHGADAVPTGLAVGAEGEVLVTLFHCGSPGQHEGGLIAILPDGTMELVSSGLSTPIAVAVDADGEIYVLEFAVDFAPYSGRLLRIGAHGEKHEVLHGLNFPTDLAIGPEGTIYVVGMANPAGGGRNTGTLLRLDVREGH